MLGIFLATLIPNPEDIVTAKVVPFVILIVVVSVWVVGIDLHGKRSEGCGAFDRRVRRCVGHHSQRGCIIARIDNF